MQVIIDVQVTRMLDGPEETAAFCTAGADGRQPQSVLFVLAAADARATERTFVPGRRRRCLPGSSR